MMKSSSKAIGIGLLSFFSAAWANSPPDPQDRVAIPQQSGEVGEFFSFDVSPFFSDPDGDTLTFHAVDWAPLPAGLSLDSNTGVLSGVLGAVDNGLSARVRIYAQDPEGAQSQWQGLTIWLPYTFGPSTDIFLRNCDAAVPECVPGFPQGPFAGRDQDINEGGASATSIVPPPEITPTLGAASMGYDGEELTPAISAYLRPEDHRMTASHFGLAHHVQSDEVTVQGTLTYSQTGGILSPGGALDPKDHLPYGAMGDANLSVFRLKPEADGKIFGSLCDWAAGNWPTEFWGGATGFRDLTACIVRGLHPHVIELTVAPFDLPERGSGIAGDNTVTAAVVGGEATTEILVEYDAGSPNQDLYIAVDMFQIARYGGEVDSQNTFKVSFSDPDAMEPQMEGVDEPSFVPAPESAGAFDVSINSGMCVHINGHGKIPIVIFGDDNVTTGDIDVHSIKFGNFPLATRGRGQPACSVENVDFDLFDDLTCQFLDDGSPLDGAPGPVQVSFNMQDEFETFFAEEEVCLD